MKETGRQCYHCKAWIGEGVPHDCWTTTESALTRDLTEDLLDAWTRLRETATAFGEQRIYASHKSIMFARRSCYFFVRPRKTALEVCFFLRRTLKHPRIRRTDQVSSSKVSHIVHVRHRDEVEAPVTDWLLEAFQTTSAPVAGAAAPKAIKASKATRAQTQRTRKTATPGKLPRRASPKRRS